MKTEHVSGEGFHVFEHIVAYRTDAVVAIAVELGRRRHSRTVGTRFALLVDVVPNADIVLLMYGFMRGYYSQLMYGILTRR